MKKYFENLLFVIGMISLVLFLTALSTLVFILLIGEIKQARYLFLATRVFLLMGTLLVAYLYKTYFGVSILFKPQRPSYKYKVWLILLIMLLGTLIGVAQKQAIYQLMPMLVAFAMTSIAEELLFRGLVEQHLQMVYPSIVAILLQGLLFACLGHLDFDLLSNLMIRWPLGILFSVVRRKSQLYSPSICLHFMYDTLISLS